MNADNYFQSDEILNIINKNYNEKIANLRVLNSFKTLYDITGKYEKNDKSYEEVISDYDSRIEFLINSVTIALTNKKIDNKTSGIIIQLYTSLYNYLMNKSSLEEITIPKEIKNKIHDKNYLPKREELKVLMTLIYSNKKIFDNEFDGVDFSQTITNGLHKNITEILRIERRNISHLLGLTSSDSSLYSFYKKAVIDKIINNIMREINWDGSNDIEKIKIFNKKFKEVFKLDFTKENYSKIIMWRYKSEKDLKRKLTPEEEILNEITALAPKEKTIDFYADKQNINKLLDENEKVNNFVYSYIRNELILKKLNNPNTRKSILRRFEDTNKLSVIQNPKISIEDKNIRVILDNYVRQYENLADNKDFKEKFINKFNYSYPLIEFDKLITKNISFYNFSLFENLNSIVLDYNPEVKNEKIENEEQTTITQRNSDLYLVSYSQKERKELDKKRNELLDKEDCAVNGEINKDQIEEFNNQIEDNNLTTNYINLIKSLVSFPPEDRYYFRQIDKIEENYNKEALKKYSTENMSLIGFATSKEEKDRIDRQRYKSLMPFTHHHYCETLESTNYYEYISNYTKRGQEYQVSILTSTGGNGYNILKIEKYSSSIENNIKKFNEFKYSNKNDISYSVNYEKELMKEISRQLDNYIMAQNINIKLYENKKLNSEMVKELNIYNLDSQKELLSELYNYNIKLKDYFIKYTEKIDDDFNKMKKR